MLTHRQLVDAQRGDGRPVTPQLRDEGELVEVPDDAGPIPRAADDDVVGRRRRQAGHGVRVAQQRLRTGGEGREGERRGVGTRPAGGFE